MAYTPGAMIVYGILVRDKKKLPWRVKDYDLMAWWEEVKGYENPDTPLWDEQTEHLRNWLIENPLPLIETRGGQDSSLLILSPTNSRIIEAIDGAIAGFRPEDLMVPDVTDFVEFCDTYLKGRVAREMQWWLFSG